MGAITFSLDSRLLKHLKTVLPLDVLIETGTFKGETVELALPYFTDIFTVEASVDYYEKALERFNTTPSVHCALGDSGQWLSTIFQNIKPSLSTLFWLDAHWCVADKTAGSTSQCPLLAELNAITSLNENSLIIIDDARLFLTSPPTPHEISHWPSFNEILNRLQKISQTHHFMVLNDCILFFPEKIEKEMHDYAYQYGTDWLSIHDKAKDYDLLLAQLQGKDDSIEQLNGLLQEKTGWPSKWKLIKYLVKGWAS